MNEENIIVFDNLVRATDVIGEYKQLEAVRPESFVAKNAAGSPAHVMNDMNDIDGISKLAKSSAANFKETFRL